MFYTFNQNNSGGSFVSNDRVDHYVIIEANSAEEANHEAESVGVYFDGCTDGSDCSCCGDRWYRKWSESEATVKPSLYGEDIFTYKPGYDRGTGFIIYYADGTKVSKSFSSDKVTHEVTPKSVEMEEVVIKLRRPKKTLTKKKKAVKKKSKKTKSSK